MNDDERIELDDAKDFQLLINSGSVWGLEGSVGRYAMSQLESGHNMLGHEPTHDYWGNRVPSRHEVQEGTKGSYGLVLETHGEEYAEELGKV